MNKQHILNEIKRTAQGNGGKALGRARFEAVTGITEGQWSGRYWARWSEAIAEAGLTPNEMTKAHGEKDLLRKVAECSIELGRLPTASQLKLKRHQDSTFPDAKVVLSRFGNKAGLAQRLMDFCESHEEFATVTEMCRRILIEDSPEDETSNDDDKFETGYVYLALMKVGPEKRYKIGKANLVEQRTRQIAIHLPEELELIHAIGTDDAYGIEAYWHKRFAEKRRGGEWFDLSTDDVRAFKRRRFM